LSSNSAQGYASGIATPVDLKISRDGAFYCLSYSDGSMSCVSADVSTASASDVDGDGREDPTLVRPAIGT